MSRDITTAVASESENQQVAPFLLVEMEFDNDPVEAWNGIGPLDWNSTTYTGMGDLGSIEPMEESAELVAKGLAFNLTGAPAASVSLALTADYHGRLARVRMGFFDDAGSIIVDPFVTQEGYMDQLTIEDEGDTSRIVVTAESRLIDLQKAREFLYDSEDQKALYPGDKGFDFVPSLQHKQIPWGVGSNGNSPGVRRVRDASFNGRGQSRTGGEQGPVRGGTQGPVRGGEQSGGRGGGL